MEKELKSCTDVLLRADLTGHSRTSLSARKDGRAMLGQPSKGHPCKILISIMFYYTISNIHQKIGDIFWPVYICGLSHSVTNKSFEHIQKLEFPFAFRCSRCKWVQKLWLLVLLRHLKWDLKNSSNHKILFLHKGPFKN